MIAQRTLSAALVALLLSSTGALAQTAPQAQPAPAEQAGVPRDFQSLDTDGNGELTQDEFRKYRVKRFFGLDRNKDGWITMAEFGPRRYSTAQQPVTGMQTARPTRDPMFVTLDQNSDDRLSEDEFVNAGIGSFDAIDEDKDGSITVAEWEKSGRAVRGRLLR